MARFRNVSGNTLDIPAAGRVVEDDAVFDVPDDLQATFGYAAGQFGDAGYTQRLGTVLRQNGLGGFKNGDPRGLWVALAPFTGRARRVA